MSLTRSGEPRGRMLLTVVAALVLSVMPLPWWLDAGRPAFLVMAVLYWSIAAPRAGGIALGFAAGLMLDVFKGAVLGQHALAYTVMAFGAVAMHRRLLWFPVLQQSLQVLPLFAVAHLLGMVVRLLGGGSFPGWPYFLSPLIEAMLWPVVTVMLLAPQRRAPDPDDNRPI